MSGKKEDSAIVDIYAERTRVAAGLASFKTMDPVALPVLTAGWTSCA